MAKYRLDQYIITYLLGYSFFIINVYSQIIYSFYSLSIMIPFTICFALFPIMIYFLYKRINKGEIQNPKTNFIYLSISILYLLISTSISFSFISTIIKHYYFPSLSFIFIIALIIIPIIYLIFKNIKILFSLSYILLIIYFIFLLIYMIGQKELTIYPLSNIFKIENKLQIILLSTTLLLEPVIMLSNLSSIDVSKKLKFKYIFFITILFCLTNIYILIRQGMEFGVLLKSINFPYIESYRMIEIISISHLDILYIFLLIALLISRVAFFTTIVKDQIRIDNKSLILILVVILLASYYLNKRLEFYKTIIIPLLMILSILLIILFITTLFSKRRKKYEKHKI